MATLIPQTTTTVSRMASASSTMSSSSNISHSNAIKRPSTTTSKVQQIVKKSSSTSLNEPCVKSAIVFAFSLNDIIKSHLPEKKFRNDKEKIEVHFAQKLIGKIQLNFAELVLTLIYCNRYLRYCRRYKLPMPGSPGSVFPSMTHMVIPCLLLAEVYLLDCPHNSKWWANKCSGGVTVHNINTWKRDVLVTMKYWLYVEPTRDFVNWTRQVKKLAFTLFGQSAWKFTGAIKSSSSKSNANLVGSTNTNNNTKETNDKKLIKDDPMKQDDNNLTTVENKDNKSKKEEKKKTSPISTKDNKVSNKTIQKKLARTNSSSFHASLHNHLNSARNSLLRHQTIANNSFSIQNILGDSYPFNQSKNSSPSVFSNVSTSTLLNVINNNASIKMASPTGSFTKNMLNNRSNDIINKIMNNNSQNQNQNQNQNQCQSQSTKI